VPPLSSFRTADRADKKELPDSIWSSPLSSFRTVDRADENELAERIWARILHSHMAEVEASLRQDFRRELEQMRMQFASVSDKVNGVETCVSGIQQDMRSLRSRLQETGDAVHALRSSMPRRQTSVSKRPWRTRAESVGSSRWPRT
jgi:hypothetical protein